MAQNTVVAITASTTVITNGALAIGTAERQVRVVDRRDETDSIVSLTLRPVSGGMLPAWTPGSHVAIVIDPETVRHYSLCQWPGQRDAYRIAVLREPEGSGGSAYLTNEVAVGDVLSIREAANHFVLTSAERYVFVAGGIGITAILPMILEAESTARKWSLVYYGASRERMAFVDELEVFGDRVTIIARDEQPKSRIDAALSDVAAGTLVYVCGPDRLLAGARSALATLGLESQLRFELFEAPAAETDASDNGSFEVRLQRSDLVLSVSPDQSILDVLREAGVDVLTDCEEGICGSCETRIVSGEAEHRDFVLTEQEKSDQSCLMVCVSRSASPVLTLAL
ncbi:PDR/VanB family oxidoreductase [soil metagenome]